MERFESWVNSTVHQRLESLFVQRELQQVFPRKVPIFLREFAKLAQHLTQLHVCEHL
jgi:hypothetical protein